MRHFWIAFTTPAGQRRVRVMSERRAEAALSRFEDWAQCLSGGRYAGSTDIELVTEEQGVELHVAQMAEIEEAAAKPTVGLTFGPTRGEWVRVECRVLLGADQVGHIPRGRAANKAEAWDLCRQEGAQHGIKEHWWRAAHQGGICVWYAHVKAQQPAAGAA